MPPAPGITLKATIDGYLGGADVAALAVQSLLERLDASSDLRLRAVILFRPSPRTLSACSRACPA